MLPNTSLISCNYSALPSIPLETPKCRALPCRSLVRRNCNLIPAISFLETVGPCISKPTISSVGRRAFHICRSTSNSKHTDGTGEAGGGGGGVEGRDWTTSFLLFVLWAGLMYYVFNLSPNQTPSRDRYLLEKLLNLKGDDGFRMNEVLVSLWYIMGLWPLVYSMLLLPTGRSSKSRIRVWPFLILSCFGGAYTLLPYFILWRPPPPLVQEAELRRWPLNFMESKVTAVMSLAAGLGLMIYAGLANGDVWKEFFQYFRERKFIHVTCIDYILLSAFAPFWVYNDMTARKWSDKGSWLLPLSLIPFVGPALYTLLRPSLSGLPELVSSTTSKQDQ